MPAVVPPPRPHHASDPPGLPARIARFGESRWFFPAVLAGVLGILFWDAVGPDCLFAYRDSLHFYPPIYRMVADEWLAGRVPLWNPLLNNGQPLAGVPTSGAFYPPQVLLAILLPDGQSLNVYVIAHLAFAAVGSYRLARYLGRSRPAASLAGITYAFGGSVLLQIYNPIYAAGAAWLVWSVLTGWKLLDRGLPKYLLGLACCLALSVLCGEPQSAYHAGLVLGLRWLWQGGRSWRGLAGLAAAAGLAGLLALPQIALAVEFTGQTSRSFDLAPHSLWELPAFFSRPGDQTQQVNWYDIFIGRPPAVAPHYQSIYGFTLVPIRLAEFWWPNVAGSVDDRWTQTIGLDSPQVWVPSLYAGVLSAGMVVSVLLLANQRLRAGGYWTAVLCGSLLLSFGSFGVVGLFRNGWAFFQGQFAELGYQAGDEVGGLYWLLSLTAPGYAGFRYPGKWMTVFMLAFGQLAARGVDGVGIDQVRRRLGWLLSLVGLGVAIAATTIATLLPLRELVATTGAGGVHAALIAGVAVMLLKPWRQHVASQQRPAVAVLLVGLAAGDVAFANRSSIFVGSYRDLVAACGYLDELKTIRLPELSANSPRLRVAAIHAKALIGSVDVQRGLRYQGMTLYCHLALLHGCEAFAEAGTAMSRDTAALCNAVSSESGLLQPRRTYDLAGVEFFVVQNDKESFSDAQTWLRNWTAAQRSGQHEGPVPAGKQATMIDLPLIGEEDGPPMILIARNESAMPRLRVVRQIGETPQATHAGWGHWIETLKRIAFPNPDVPDLFHAALVESSAELGRMLTLWRQQADPAAPAEDRCRIVVDEPQRVIAEVDLAKPGLVILADSYSDDWQLAVSRDGGQAVPEPILRVNQIHRGCGLPAGRHRLEFRYHSRTFARTWPVSAAMWSGLGIAAVSSLLRRPRRIGEGQP